MEKIGVTDNPHASSVISTKKAKKKPTPKLKRDVDWVKAKAKCHLNQKDIEMAKKLGIGPRTLMKNIPSPQQRWKAPVKQWIHDLYEKRFGLICENNEKKFKGDSDDEKQNHKEYAL